MLVYNHLAHSHPVRRLPVSTFSVICLLSCEHGGIILFIAGMLVEADLPPSHGPFDVCCFPNATQEDDEWDERADVLLPQAVYLTSVSYLGPRVLLYSLVLV